MVAAAAYYLWIAFLVSWWLAALWTNRATSRGAPMQQLGYFLGFAIGFWLLFTPPLGVFGSGTARPFGQLIPARWQLRLWVAPTAVIAVLLFLELGAFAFAWWARLHLGRLWSGMLTLREGHRVIDSGPYALVRHPIYTGFIAASWVLALIVAGGTVLIGAAILTLVMTIKAKTEEALLRRELGAASYDAYRARVPMLIPFSPL